MVRAGRWARCALAAGLCLACAPAASRAVAQPRDDVVVAAALRDWPPYYDQDADGRPTGFAVDTMQAVAERAGLAVEFRVYDDFPSALAALERGEIDLIPNCGITEHRKERFDFTTPLETFDVTLFVRSEEEGVASLDDLAGRQVAVVQSNVGVGIVERRGDVRPVVYEDVRTALYELLAGRVDGLVFPRPVIWALAHRAKVGDQIEAVGPSLGEVKRGMAVHAGDPLLSRLEPAVTELARSSEYASIYKRWFTPAPPFWTAGRVATVAGSVAVVALILFLFVRMRWYRRVADAVVRRERAEEERRTTEGRYRRLLEQASDGIFISDSDGRYTEVNRRACEMVGYSREELLGMRIPDLLAPGELDERPLVLDDLRVGKVMLRERTFRRADGTTFPVEISATRLEDGSLQGIVRDISERVAAEEAIRERDDRLRQSQKMEAIGRLAGGVAHDFNNLLTVILGNGEVLRDGLGQRDRERLEEMMEAGERAADLTRQLLAFSRKQVVKAEPVDVGAVVRELQRMLERIIGEDVSLEVEVPPEPCTVLADRAQLEQVLLNLAVNARDAMPSGGELSIRCALEAEDDEAPGWVLLEVRDTGHGMDADTRAHLFEPFYTTKGQGHGTGLGLATVHSIVEQAGGHIAVESAPGRGATFRIHLPLHDGTATTTSAQGARAPARAAHQYHVLVVEDEPGVRRLLVRVLRQHDYDVLEAVGPDEALALCADAPPIDLLVTDIVMPSKSGVDLADRLAERYPDLRVLFISGYPQRSLDDALEPPGRAFLAKPFGHAELLERVSALLDAGVRTA